jgi:hypothetical protein
MADDVTPGPAEAAPGHNSGATPADLKSLMDGLPSVDELVALLITANQDALDRVKGLTDKGGEFLFIDSDAKDADATEFLVKLRARYTTSEAERAAIKQRFDELAGAVQAFFRNGILDPLGAAPTNKREEFDPMTATQYGMGVRITMAQTLFKRRKVEEEQRARDAEAARQRKIEADAAAAREAERLRLKKIADDEKAARDAADAAAAAERKRIADEAAETARQLAAAASRKRNEETRLAAEAAAAEAQRIADEAAAAQAEEDRKAEADRVEAQRLADQAAEAQAEADRAEENRLAEARSKAEEAAAARTADLSRARGGKGGVSSLREFVDFRDLKRDQLGVISPNAHQAIPSVCYLLPFLKDAALESAVKEYAKANKQTVADGIKTGRQPLHGVVFFMNNRSAGRK